MSKRCIALIVSLSIMFVSIIGRIGYLSISNKTFVNNGHNSYSLLIDKRDTNLYYLNGGRINNNTDSYVAIIRPNSKCISELDKLYTQSEKMAIIEELKSGYPVVKEARNIKTRYITIVKTSKSNNTLSQLISRESSGLLSFDEMKPSEKRMSFSVDALGRMLQGDNGTIIDDEYYINRGYKLSIDSRIQSITYNACVGLKSGCAIVMDVDTGNILSMVTKPNDSFLNKCILQYPVGSVFKLIVTACAIENDVDLYYYCNGNIKVSDTTFSCQKGKAHGYENLKSALANSCNCYYVNLINTLGREKIQVTANKFGFYDTTNLFNNWTIENASMPSNDELSSLGELSLLGFGQGKLTSTPLHLCSALCSLSSGYKTTPKLVIGTVDEKGKISKFNADNKHRIFDNKRIMREYMRYVVTDGTGFYAESETHKSAGKTATIETSNPLVNNTCFAGIYPYDNPKYAIVIMCENGKTGAEDCCPIFRTIVENIDLM